MKVVHILNELKFSGAEIMYVSAAPEFKKLGCELFVVNIAPALGEYATQFEQAGYRVLHWPYAPKNIGDKLAYVKKVVDFLKTEKIDVVHIHLATWSFLWAYCAWKAGCKSVCTFHNVFPTRWFTHPIHIGKRWAIKNVFGCTFQTISDSVYQHEKDFYYNDTCKIYNWYDNSRFFPANESEKSEIRTQLNIPEKALVIISIGGCSHIKRHSDVINALPIILKKYPNLIYFHLGEGEMLEAEQIQAKDLGLSQHIRFEGNQTDVRKFLVASDIYVMPSKHEGIPITTIETLACKIPAILYDVPGLRDFNNTTICAKIIPEDYKELAKAIMELYKNKNEQQLLTTNGKAFVDSEFYMSNNVKKIVELYR